MSEQSANQAYHAIIMWLRENDLDWVASQVEDEVAIGTTSYGAITPARSKLSTELGEIVAAKRARVSGEFLAREEYTEQEKYEIAIGALDVTVNGAIKIQTDLVSTLQQISSGPTDLQIIFAGEGESYSYASRDLTERNAHSAELSALLHELRSEVEK